MNLDLDEQSLLVNFRKLSDEGRRQVHEMVLSLVNSSSKNLQEGSVEPDDRCSLPRSGARSKSALESIITE